MAFVWVRRGIALGAAAGLTMLGAAAGCAPVESGGTCPEGKLHCGDVCCPDDEHYACSADGCELTSCNDGLYMCGGRCIPITADCCDQVAGSSCTGEVCCGGGCIPVGAACCGNGKYCPAGSGCCNGGTQCC